MPACVEASNGAIVFGDLDDPDSEVREVLRTTSPSGGNRVWEPNRAFTTSCEVYMLELAVKGKQKGYWIWVLALLGVIGAGFAFYSMQLQFGLGITGMSRDVSWGFYIANFTYLVGVAAGGVMVVLPYYLHDYKAYGRITLWANFWPSPPSSCVCCLFWPTWAAHARLQRAALPDPEFRAVL
jgi:hypothetical protein